MEKLMKESNGCKPKKKKYSHQLINNNRHNNNHHHQDDLDLDLDHNHHNHRRHHHYRLSSSSFSSSNSTFSSSSSSFILIILVSFFSLLLFHNYFILVIDAQKSGPIKIINNNDDNDNGNGGGDAIVSGHHYRQPSSTISVINNKPIRFRNGTVFQFGSGHLNHQNLQKHHQNQRPSSSSSPEFDGTVIHVSSGVNVLDDRTQTGDSWIHRDSSTSTTSGVHHHDGSGSGIRIPTSAHQNFQGPRRPISGGSDDIHYEIIDRSEWSPSSSSHHHRNGFQSNSHLGHHGTDLEAYHRAASIDDGFDDHRSISSSSSGHSDGRLQNRVHFNGTSSGTSFGHSSNVGSSIGSSIYGGVRGGDGSNLRYETGSISRDYLNRPGGLGGPGGVVVTGAGPYTHSSQGLGHHQEDHVVIRPVITAGPGSSIHSGYQHRTTGSSSHHQQSGSGSTRQDGYHLEHLDHRSGSIQNRTLDGGTAIVRGGASGSSGSGSGGNIAIGTGYLDRSGNINRTVITGGGTGIGSGSTGYDHHHQHHPQGGGGVLRLNISHIHPETGHTIHSESNHTLNVGNRTIIHSGYGRPERPTVHHQPIIYAGPGSPIYSTGSSDGGVGGSTNLTTTAAYNNRTATIGSGIVSGGGGGSSHIHLPIGHQDRTLNRTIDGTTTTTSSFINNRTQFESTPAIHLPVGHQDHRFITTATANDVSNRTYSDSYRRQQQGLNRTNLVLFPALRPATSSTSSGSGISSSTSGRLDRIESTNRLGSGVVGGGSSSVRLDDRNRIETIGGSGSGSDGTSPFGRIQVQPNSVTATEYDRVNVPSSVSTGSTGGSSTINREGTGTAIELNQLDNVDVEAINKARIYAEHENEAQAKKHAQNVVRLAATDQLESEIITNKTKAYLSCESGEMIVKINFTEPFRGVGYADYDRSSPCKFYGDGGKYYEMRLPLKGCGTKQEAPRIFINNIILRFHRSLELEEDEIKTIICRYPPPLAPPPPIIAAPILEQPPPVAPFIPAKLSEVELLLIVSALLFLTLLLLGIGIGYYCLKKRKVKVVKRKFIPPQEIPYFPPPSISSEEEHSIISEASILQRDDYQFQNLGYIPETKLSNVDDMYYNEQNFLDQNVMLQQENFMVPPLPLYNTKKFDDKFVTNISETDVETDYEIDRMIVPKKPKITKLITEDYFLTPKTTTEIIDEVTTHRIIVPPKKKPLQSKKFDDQFLTNQSDNLIDEEITTQQIIAPPPGPKISTQEQDDYFRTDSYEIDEIIDDVSDIRIAPAPPPPPPPIRAPTTRITQTTEDDEIITHLRENTEELIIDDYHLKSSDHQLQPIPSQHKPKITVQNIDDFYVTNITETETSKHVTKIGRSMPNLTLEIDDYYHEEEREQLEQEEEISRLKTSAGFDVRMRSIPRQPEQHPKTTTTTTETETTEITREETTKISMDKFFQLLENPPREKIPQVDDYFLLPTRNRLKQIIMTDETFRTIICESTTIEEYTEKIQHNPKYGPLFEPPTWQVIFRLLSLPELKPDRPPTTKTPGKLGRYSDTFRSGISAHEVRSVTEEDVTFTARKRLTGSHYVPLPDYPMDDDDDDDDDPKLRSSKHWASQLPDPKHFDRYSPDYSPIKPAFGGSATTGRRRPGRGPTSPTSSSVFGGRRLENPYTTVPTTAATTTSPLMRRNNLYEYDLRPYSPDLDALSLAYSSGSGRGSGRGSIRKRFETSTKQQLQQQHEEIKEEIKSTTETNVYDWKRYG